MARPRHLYKQLYPTSCVAPPPPHPPPPPPTPTPPLSRTASTCKGGHRPYTIGLTAVRCACVAARRLRGGTQRIDKAPAAEHLLEVSAQDVRFCRWGSACPHRPRLEVFALGRRRAIPAKTAERHGAGLIRRITALPPVRLPTAATSPRSRFDPKYGASHRALTVVDDFGPPPSTRSCRGPGPWRDRTGAWPGPP